MPSPFPGMDPYLERPDLWPDVHGALISAMREMLVPLLRPKYVARTEVQVVMEKIGDPDELAIFRPDVAVMDPTRTAQPAAPVAASAPAPLRLANATFELEYRQRWIEIRATADERLVTVIELLSPVNKRSDGYTAYTDKRERLLQSKVHLIEIDLLRKGWRIELVHQLPEAAYFVFLSRANERPWCDVWPLQLHNSLPTIPVPLLTGDTDIPLDLSEALRIAYDRAGYDLSIDYSAEPVPPLTDEQAAWADALLRERGVRPAT